MTDSTPPDTTPDGYVDPTTLKRRGWTAELISELLRPHGRHTQQDNPSASPWSYPALLVAQLETEDPRVIDEIAAVSGAVSQHAATATRLRAHLRSGGRLDRLPARDSAGYPLRERVSRVRSDHRAGTLPAAHAAAFEEIPGFSWEGPPAKRMRPRSVQQWIDLIELCVQRAGSGAIPAHHTTADPNRPGEHPNIGEWLARARSRQVRLTRDERKRLIAILKSGRRAAS